MPRTMPELLLMLSSEDLIVIQEACAYIRSFPTNDKAIIEKLTSLTFDNRVVVMGPAPFIRYGQLKWEAVFALGAVILKYGDPDFIRINSTYEPMNGMKALELMLAHPEIEDPYDTLERFRILYEKGLIEICDFLITPTGQFFWKVKDSCIGG